MNKIIARCGCYCSNCPTFKNNIRTSEERERCSLGWKTYLGISLSPEKLRLCDGCMADDKDKPTRYLNCIVRRCAIRNGIKNCAFCSEFPCTELKNVHEGQVPDYRGKIETKIGRSVPEKDYIAFIEPYEGLKHLEKLRKTLGSDEIVGFSPLTLKSKTVMFSQDGHFAKREWKSFQTLYRILAAITEPLNGISFARREREKKERIYILKLLWTCGLSGRIKTDKESCLILDSVSYFKSKNQYRYPVLEGYFERLLQLDIRCKLVPLPETEWKNDYGILKINAGKKNEPAWIIEFSFGNEAGGFSTVRALQRYTRMLQDTYGDKGFEYFSKGDMTLV